MKMTLCGMLILASFAAQAQEVVRSKTIKVTSKNLVDAYYETNFYDKVKLVIEFKNSNGAIEKVSGNYWMEPHDGDTMKYCTDYMKLGKVMHEKTNLVYCKSKVNFLSRSNTSAASLSALDINDFMSGILENDFSEISNSSAQININQSVSSGDARSTNTSQAGSQATSFRKRSLLVAASQATGGSSARSSADNNTLSSDNNTAINNVESCSRLSPEVVIQYVKSSSESEGKILSLDLGWNAKLIKCP